jgi:hypothetical protein
MKYDETLSLTECRDGFWLYDTTRGMNLAMREKTKDEAFFKALKYYQERLLKVEAELKELNKKVDSFVLSVRPEEEDIDKRFF